MLLLDLLREILSYNTTPWCLQVSKNMREIEKGLIETRLSRMGGIEQMVRQERWEEVVYLVNNTDTFTKDIDVIYYIMDSERFITGRKVVERLSPHISKSERRSLLRNLMVYEETSIVSPLLDSYVDIYDSDSKYMVKYGWVGLIRELLDTHRWDVRGVSRYAAKYGRLDIYSFLDEDGRDIESTAILAANNDRVNILDYIISKELGDMSKEEFVSDIYDRTWSSITKSYIEERGRDDSVMSTAQSLSETEDLELYV